MNEPAISPMESAIAAQTPADDFQKMVESQLKLDDKDAKKEFAKAMAQIQRDIPAILKDSANEHTRSKFAKLSAILHVIRPVYTHYGISLIFGEATCPRENWIRIVAVIMHEGGHTMEVYNDVPTDTHGMTGKVNKTEMHGNASAKEYAQRYLMKMIFTLELAEFIDTDGSPPVEYINADQQTVIADLIKETESNTAGYLKNCKAESIEKITVSQYGVAVRMLEAKRLKQQQQQQQKQQ